MPEILSRGILDKSANIPKTNRENLLKEGEIQFIFKYEKKLWKVC
jgi:hypothetical protein